jgi:hypothetical protein
MNYQPPPPPPGPPAGGPPQPPQQPGYEQPYAQPDPLAAEQKKRKQQLGILSAVGVVLIVAAFFGGKAIEKKNYDPGKDGYNAIYAQGAAAGGAAGKKAGEKSGKEKGVAEGTEEGQKAGQLEGETEGQKSGASAALGGFSDWDTGVPYATIFEHGPSEEIPFAIKSRTLFQPGTLYKICDSGNGVCTASAAGPTE